MADNEMMTGYLAGKSDAGGGNGMGCGMMWPWMMGAGMGMGFGGMGWGGYGGMIGEWIPLLFLAGIFGWGNNGFGGGGRGDYATQADLAAGFNNSAVLNKLNDITLGQANAINYNNQGFAGLNTALMQGFNGVDNAVCNLGYQTQNGFNGIARQMADCCCNIERGIDRATTQGVMNTNAIQQQIQNCCCDLEKMNLQNRFDNAQTANGTLLAIDKLGDRIIGYMANKETQELRDEVQAYSLKASQAQQNEYLLAQLRPCPVPAYPACNPYAPVQGWGTGNGCGCGCAA